MKTSIIVCLYNTENKKFEKCMNSICTSTLTDYEVLVIDDGSTEDYSEIIEKYNPVYVKTQNRGLLAARLYGIALARGEYIAFVDSDDAVTFNYHAPMVEEAEKSGCDIVINDWAFKTASTVASCYGDSIANSDFCIEGDEILRKYAMQRGKEQAYFVAWNKLFKRELLLKAKSDIEKTSAIMQKQVYAEDVINTFFAFKNAKKVKNIHTGYYLYHLHEGQSVSVSGAEALKTQIDEMTRTFKVISASVGENRYAKEISENLSEWKSLMCRIHFSYAKSLNEDWLCEYVGIMYNEKNPASARAKDSYGYIASGLLGDNLEGIDTVLRWIYKKGQDVSIKYDKKDKYVADSITYIEKVKGIKISFSENAQLVIPKRTVSFKNKLLHNRFVNTVGMALFPKGSRLRNFFKSKL